MLEQDDKQFRARLVSLGCSERHADAAIAERVLARERTSAKVEESPGEKLELPLSQPFSWPSWRSIEAAYNLVCTGGKHKHRFYAPRPADKLGIGCPSLRKTGGTICDGVLVSLE